MSATQAKPVEGVTDAQFCQRIVATACRLGYQVDKMDTSIGWSFAFIDPNGKRIAGSVQRDSESALVDACKRLLPHVYQHLWITTPHFVPQTPPAALPQSLPQSASNHG